MYKGDRLLSSLADTDVESAGSATAGFVFIYNDTTERFELQDPLLLVGVSSLLDYFNGAFLETFNALVTSDGATITLALEKDGGGDLTMVFSDGHFVLDCTPPLEITLTAGTDGAPKSQWIYIPVSTKVLTLNDTGFPTDTEHIKIAYGCIPTAAFVQAHGTYTNQNWNDHAVNGDGIGHIFHISERLRRMGASWFSGVDGNGTTDYLTITTNIAMPDNVHFKSTAGLVYQLHRQVVAAKDTSASDIILVINHPTSPFDDIQDIATQLTDALGGSMTGRYFNFVFITVANKEGEFSPVAMNLPTGSYNVLSDALQDVDGFDVYDMPREWSIESSTGFYTCRITLKHSNVGGGTWTHISTTDLRRVGPFGVTGGVGATITDFSDGQFSVFYALDNTAGVVFDCSGITTGNFRSVAWPDEDITVGVDQEKFQGRRTSDLALVVGWTDIGLDTEDHEDSIYSHTGSNATVTVNKDGDYLVTFSGRVKSDSAVINSFGFRIVKNAAEVSGSRIEGSLANTTSWRTWTSQQFIVNVTSGDTLKVQAAEGAAGNATLECDADVCFTLGITRLTP